MTNKDFWIAIILVNVASIAVIVASILGGNFDWWIDAIGAITGIATVNGLFITLTHISGIRV